MDILVRIEALENNKDLEGSQAVGSESGSTLEFEKIPESDPLAVKFAYNKKNGVLSLIRGPNDILTASGFLTAKDLGRGKRGRKGKRGKDGADGREGSLGRDGKTGCPGIPGQKGKKGLAGRDAEDGPVGPVGKAGCGGEAGEDGERGDKGINGPQGSQGFMGSSCKQGPEGPIGEKPLESVLFSDTPPIDNVLAHIWAKPVVIDPVVPDPTLPPVLPPIQMSGKVNSLTASVPPVGGGWYQTTLYFKIDSFVGGIGPFTYKWSGDYTGKVDLTVVDTGEVSGNLNLRIRIYIAGTENRRVTGNLKCTVTDTGDGSKKIELPATYTFNISATATGGGDSGGGGSGGCIVYGQQVNVSGTKKIPVQSVQFGDQLLGAKIVGLPDSTNNPNAFLDWSTDKVSASQTGVIVQTVKHSTFSEYYYINAKLKLTLEENILASRSGIWKYIRVRDLKIGDLLYHISGESHEVTSIEIISGKVQTVALNVESVDTFFVEDYLLHNIDAGGPVMKH